MRALLIAKRLVAELSNFDFPVIHSCAELDAIFQSASAKLTERVSANVAHKCRLTGRTLIAVFLD